MIFGWLTPLLTLAAFVLLLLATLSTPIIKSIYLYKLVANVSEVGGLAKITGSARFGVWGYCTGGITGAIRGVTKSSAAFCSPKSLGYTDNLTNMFGIHSGALSKALKAALVLHPIAAGLALLALIFGLLMARPTRGTTRFSSLLAALTSLLAALVATAAFVVDIVAGAVIRRHVHQDGVSLKYGNAVWMVLGAMVALWLALITATCGIFQLRRHRRAQQTTY